MSQALAVVLQTPTPTPGVGPGELTDLWPLVRRGAWFLVGAIATAVVVWVAVAPLAGRLVHQRNRNNPTIDDAVTRYVRLLGLLLGVVVGVALAGYGHVVADSAVVVAAATLVLGVAGQTVIGSLVSGVVLVMDPQFNVGDYIEWTEGEGTVQSITLRVTRVVTPDGELLTVPNTVLTGQTLRRPYGRNRYRLVEQVGLAYEDDVDEALDLLVAAAEAVEDVAEAPSPRAYVDEFGPDSVVLRVHLWIADPRQDDVFAVRSAYAREIKERLEAAGITISPASKRDLQGRIAVGPDDEGPPSGTRGPP